MKMKTLEDIVDFGKINEDAVIEERPPVLIFDKTTANNVLVYLMGRNPHEMYDAEGKIDQRVMLGISRTLIENFGLLSDRYAKPLKIGEDTIVFSANHDLTGSDQTANVRGEPKEVYIGILAGSKLNGRENKKNEFEAIPKMDRDPKMPNDDEIPTVYSKGMGEMYGYTSTNTTKIYNHLFGTNFEEPPKQNNWRKTALITALALGAAAAIGLYSHHVNSKSNTPTKSSIEKYIEPSRSAPLTKT